MSKLTAVVLLFALTVSSFAEDAAALYRRYRGAIVSIATSKATGTGFAIGDGTLVVTCYHVVKEDASHINVAGGSSTQAAEMVEYDESTDLALLKIPTAMHTRLALNEGASPDPGTKIYVIGDPLGFVGSMSDGIVGGLRKTPNVTFLQISAPISPGSSGSPVLLASGRVVGVAAKFFADGQNLNFAVSAYDVNNLIAQYRRALKSGRSVVAKTGTNSEGRVVLGKLGQTTTATQIHSAPNSRSRVYYRAKAFEYLVLVPYKSHGWYKVMLKNGADGYVPADTVAQLPYAVTQVMPRSAAVEGTPEPKIADSTVSAKVANIALGYVGAKYLAGGQDPLTGIDSGYLVKLAFSGIGIDLPESPAKQVDIGRPIDRLEALQIGDRMYFWDDKRKAVAWCAIYLGNGYAVGAVDGKDVATFYVGTKGMLKELVAARR